MDKEWFRTLCRICSKDSFFYFNIYHGDSPTYQIIKYVLDLQICEDDGLPTHVCRGCVSVVEKFNDFKTRAQKAESHLMSLKQRIDLVQQLTSGADGAEEEEAIETQVQGRALRSPSIKEELEATTNQVFIKVEDAEADDDDSVFSWFEGSSHLVDPLRFNTKFVETTNGRRKLLHEGYAYVVDRKRAGLTYWRCENLKGCSGRLKTMDDVVQGKASRHNHPADDAQMLMPPYIDSVKRPTEETAEGKDAIMEAQGCASEGIGIKEEDEDITAPQQVDIKGEEITIEEEPYFVPECIFSEEPEGECVDGSAVESVRRDVEGSRRGEEQEEGEWVMCHHCGIRKDTKEEITTHIHEAHGFGKKGESGNKVKKYLCGICNKGFAGTDRLVIHMRTHTGDKPYRCPVCEKRFNQRSNLHSHMHIHSLYKQHKCSVCEKRFKFGGDLKRHVQIHSEEKRYECSVCEKRFSVKGSLTVHMRIHTGYKPYECPFCEKRFSVNHSFNRHVRIHSGLRPYKCTVCEKLFSDNSTMKRHMRIHVKEKPYSCSQCGKGFLDSRSLSVHERVHSGDKPYKCSLCDQKYTESSSLKRHMKKHKE